jgi:hypothetical protein
MWWTFDDGREDVKREVRGVARDARHRETSAASFVEIAQQMR